MQVTIKQIKAVLHRYGAVCGKARLHRIQQETSDMLDRTAGPHGALLTRHAAVMLAFVLASYDVLVIPVQYIQSVEEILNANS